jgi:hypothetical protein
MDGKDTVSSCTSFSSARVVFEREKHLRLSNIRNLSERSYRRLIFMLF